MSRTTVLVGSFVAWLLPSVWVRIRLSGQSDGGASHREESCGTGWAAGVAGSPDPVYGRQVPGGDLLLGLQDGERLDDTLRHGDGSAGSQATREDRD